MQPANYQMKELISKPKNLVNEPATHQITEDYRTMQAENLP